VTTRLGFLIPPANPTIEPEMNALAPPGVTVHFSRMVIQEGGGGLEGQEERNRTQLAHLDETADLLIKVKPAVMMMAHAAMSYTLGRKGEAELMARMEQKYATRVSTAFAGVLAALEALGVKRVALGAPYAEGIMLKGKALLEEHGFEVVSAAVLPHGGNIYDLNAGHAAELARLIDRPEADAIYLSGLGLPTIAVLERLERDQGKPVISAATAMMWHALRLAGVPARVPGYGRLLA